MGSDTKAKERTQKYGSFGMRKKKLDVFAFKDHEVVRSTD